MNVDLSYLLTVFLVSIRIGGMTFLIPIFGARFMPRQVAIVFIALVSMMMTPTLQPMLPEIHGLWHLVEISLGELLVGILLGLAVRAFFALTEVAGHVISAEMGLMMAQQFDPDRGAQTQMISILLFYLAALLFMMIGAHHMIFSALFNSYGLVGFDKNTLIVGNPHQIIQMLSTMFSLAVSISAPFIAVNFLITLSFGVLGKVAPKINVMLISFSFRILGGMIVLLISATLIFNFLLGHAAEAPRTMLKFLL